MAVESKPGRADCVSGAHRFIGYAGRITARPWPLSTCPEEDLGGCPGGTRSPAKRSALRRQAARGEQTPRGGRSQCPGPDPEAVPAGRARGPRVQPGGSASAGSGIRADRGPIPRVLHPARFAATKSRAGTRLMKEGFTLRKAGRRREAPLPTRGVENFLWTGLRAPWRTAWRTRAGRPRGRPPSLNWSPPRPRGYQPWYQAESN